MINNDNNNKNDIEFTPLPNYKLFYPPTFMLNFNIINITFNYENI